MGKLFPEKITRDINFICDIPKVFTENVRVNGQLRCTGKIEFSLFKFIWNEAPIERGFPIFI